MALTSFSTRLNSFKLIILFFLFSSSAAAADIEWSGSSESEHFIYHFDDAKTARAITDHAETYYRWVKEIFQVDEDHWKEKAPIFIFEDKAEWKTFESKNGAGIGGDAFTNGRELYIWRNPSWLSPKKTLAHELTHLIIRRFLDGPIPLFLNEGFAEYIGTKAAALQTGGNEYAVRTLQFLSEDEFVPLKQLSEMKSYPKDQVPIFYRESELLVRFLLLKHPPSKFRQLLSELSRGKAFDRLIEDLYETDFGDFSGRFKTYALTGK